MSNLHRILLSAAAVLLLLVAVIGDAKPLKPGTYHVGTHLRLPPRYRWKNDPLTSVLAGLAAAAEVDAVEVDDAADVNEEDSNDDDEEDDPSTATDADNLDDYVGEESTDILEDGNPFNDPRESDESIGEKIEERRIKYHERLRQRQNEATRRKRRVNANAGTKEKKSHEASSREKKVPASPSSPAAPQKRRSASKRSKTAKKR